MLEAYIKDKLNEKDILLMTHLVIGYHSLEASFNIIEKMVSGKLDKHLGAMCLLEQPFLKNQDQTVDQLVQEMSGKIGEKISIRRFVRFVLGEGLEKRQHDLAAEVAAEMEKYKQD